MINWWKNLNGTDKILVMLSLFMLAFIITVFIIFVKVGSEPSTLITVVGGAVIAELLALLVNKANKRKQEILKKDKCNE